MPNWTEEQLRAIEARGNNILLSAAAGSGKTTVLVERVLRLIADEGASVDRMLVVTFTKAAASDMKGKLSDKMNERAASGNLRCREQLFKLDRAGITTIHAFCSEFLRTHFEAAGVDPAFRILDDAMSERLRARALDEALEEAYAGEVSRADDAPQEDDAPVLHPSDELRALDYGRGPSGVRAAADMLMRYLDERPDPEAWLQGACDMSEEHLQRLEDEIKSVTRRDIDTAILYINMAIATPGCPVTYEKSLLHSIEELKEIRALEGYDELYRALEDFKLGSPRANKADDPAAVEMVKKLRDNGKKAIADTPIRELPLLTVRADAIAQAPQLRALASIALRARALFDEKKQAQSGLTYSDLEHKTLAALRDEATAAELRDRYDYVFIDEYQDTSDLQEALIGAICRADNRFMVGDVKQSIYRFRLAEPRLFLQKYADYRAGKSGLLLPLTRNFRSERGILDFVNMVFERTMTGGETEIEYDELARLNPGDPSAPQRDVPDVDIVLIDKGGEPDAEAAPGADADDAESLADLSDAEREGALIARTILKMRAEDPSLKFGDFAILTRTKAVPFSAMLPVLLASGVPAYADGATGFFESIEIAWTLSMLKYIDNARLDVELIGLLHSPVFGLSAEMLSRVRVAYPNCPFCDAAKAYATDREDEIAAKLRTFFELCDAWRLKLGGVALGELVNTVLDESGFYTYAGALPGGAQRQANLDRFVVTASDFDRQTSGALTRFLQYTEHMREKGDGDAAHLLSESDDVVRMMTIHKSKGLEFKIVFGAQLAKKYRTRNTGVPLLTHRDLGMGMSCFDPELRTRRRTLAQEAIIRRGVREDAAEELRILYVLLTRAMKKLVLVGTVKDKEKALTRWRALSASPFGSASHLDVLMAARCGAEKDGRPLYSTLTSRAASDIRMPGTQRETGSAIAIRRMDGILGDDVAYIDDALEAQLRWRYADPQAAEQPLKLTASGLLRELEGPGEVPQLTERPHFMMEDAGHMTGAERGTAYHRAMQLIDYRAIDGVEGRALVRVLADQLDDHAAHKRMTDVQREAVSPVVLARFVESEVGTRLRNAKIVRREWPFNARFRAGEVLTEAEARKFPDAELLVQGTIDCCFMEDGKWVLIDYKTDRTDDEAELRAHYERQLGLYALALETITGTPVKERILCLISQNKTIKL